MSGPEEIIERKLKIAGMGQTVTEEVKGVKKLSRMALATINDLIGEALDPETLHRLMDGCFEILGDVVHGTGGTINQYTGDGIMAFFGAPIALDDYVAKACYAGLEIQRRLKDYQKRASRTWKVNFQMRIGIHAGRVLVGAIGDNLRLNHSAIGDTTDLAARLQASAEPGGIHVSQKAAGTVGHLFHFINATITQHAFVLTGSCRAYGASEPFQLLMKMLAGTFSSDRPTTGKPSAAFRHLIEQADKLLDRFNHTRKQLVHEDTLLEGRKMYWTPNRMRLSSPS